MTKFDILMCVKLAILVHVVQSDMMNTLMKPIKISCSPNIKRANFTCGLKAISRNEYHINAGAILYEPLRNFSVRFETFKMYNGYRPYVVNSTEYFCEFMAGRRHSLILEVAKRFLDRYSNFNHTCPYTDRVFVRGLRYTPGTIPSVVPQGKYRMRFTVFDDTKIEPYIGLIDLYTEVTEQRIRRTKRSSVNDYILDENFIKTYFLKID